MAPSALAGRFGTGLHDTAAEGLATGLKGLPFVHSGGDATTHLGIELGHGHRLGELAVTIMFTILPLEALQALLHLAVEGLGPSLPPGVIDPVKAVEGLPPAVLLHKLRSPLPLQPVAVPVQPQLITDRRAIGAMLLAHRRQGVQSSVEVTVAEAAQGHAVQGRLPVLQALPVSTAAGGGIEQLPLQSEGRGPAPLLPELGGLLTSAAALIEGGTAGKPAKGIELIAVAQTGVELATGGGGGHPGRQLALPPVHETDPRGDRSQGDG